MELADRALSDPVLGPALGRLGDILGGISLGDGGLLVAALAFILDGRLLVFVLVLLVFGALVDEALGRGAAFGAVLRAAADGEGVAIGPFDVDVLLLDSRQLAVQLVGVLHLPDVKLGREGAQAGVEAAEVVLPRRLIVVVNETEDRGEFLEAREERHCACGCVEWCFGYSAAELLWKSLESWAQ